LAVYSGVLHANRNLVPLVEAFKTLDDVHLAVVCVPSAHHPQAALLADKAEALGVGDRVHLVDPVAPEQVVTLLTEATVGVIPIEEGLANHEMALPNKLFDYIWAGLPVAVSRAKSMARLVEDAGLGVTFDPRDPAAGAAAIRRLLADLPAFRAAVRDPALRARFGWEAQAAKLATLYASLTDQAR
jgi:glycosyltransferase involved in cell wall biosynthesis